MKFPFDFHFTKMPFHRFIFEIKIVKIAKKRVTKCLIHECVWKVFEKSYGKENFKKL